jgi:hypothetical protein
MHEPYGGVAVVLKAMYHTAVEYTPMLVKCASTELVKEPFT